MTNAAPLAQQRCVPCRGGVVLPSEERDRLLATLPGWALVEEGKAIRKRYNFANFAAALAFVNRVGPVADAEDHHPDITFGWGYAEFRLTTHDLGGLHGNDFIVAAKIEELFEKSNK